MIRYAARAAPLALAFALAFAQDPVVVRVGDAPLGPVPALATAGFNYGNSMRVVGFEASFDAIRIGSLRFPPGNQADEIRVGRPDIAALAANLELLGRPPVTMVANLFEGDPEEAAELARLAREMEIPVAAWEVGNEPDLYATNRADPSWTPARWCEAFRAFRAALRAVDPDVPIAGPAVSGARPGGESYLREVLRRCGDAIDVLTWHVYPTDGTWSDEAALATSGAVGEEVRRFRALTRDPEANPLGHGDPPRLAVTEFGLSWRTRGFRHLEDMTAALWLADVLGRMTTERLDASHYFALQGTGGHGLLDVGGWVRPTWHVYALLATFTGQALPVDAGDGPRAYAVRDDGRVEVLLVHDGLEPALVDLRLPGAPEDLEIAVLDAPTFDRDGAPQRRRASPTEPIRVPPRSVVHLRTPAAP